MRLCSSVFLNLYDESGCPDPLAFHGGENLLDVFGDGKQKKLDLRVATCRLLCNLHSFREVPVSRRVQDDTR